ncbi:MAG: TerB family tellurite resistance protein [Rhodobacteraceae bacterium]|nr:TerB family tellurite resistance protein [Paracoccaceae bacterium]
MFNLRRIFRATRPVELPEPDAKLALGALLVRVARSDRDYQFSEIRLIDRILARMYNLKPIAAAKMRATCERLNAAAPDSDRFAVLIRDSLPPEDRITALAALWEVVMADGAEADEELRIVEAARHALGLDDAQSAEARARAMSK